MVLILHNLSAQSCRPEIWTKRALFMQGPERYRSFGEAHLPLFPFPEPDAPRGLGASLAPVMARPGFSAAGSIWVGGKSGPSKFDNDRFRTLSQSNGLHAESSSACRRRRWLLVDCHRCWSSESSGRRRSPIRWCHIDVACCLVFRAGLG